MKLTTFFSENLRGLVKINARFWNYIQGKITLDSFFFTSAVMHGNKIVQYLQNFKRHEIDQGRSRKLLQRVVQVTSKS